MLVLDVLLVALAVPALICTTYLFVLSIFASAPRWVPTTEAPTTRFDIVVPAHNESAGIAATIESLLGIDYPPELRRVVVVADNCSDDTAAKAEAAGATVFVRFDDKLKGKGYALAHAFEKIEAENKVDAVVVVDADTTVSKNLLAAFARRYAAGAHAMQADYAVRNREDSWRTRLMVIALAIFHVLRSLGRERLSLSAGLRGNGMCFSREVLREVPHDAFSVVEDLEYGIRLGMKGYRVHYAHDAHVYGEMVAGEKDSRSQRRRWEQGRFAMMKSHGPKLLGEGLRTRNGVLLDLAMDVLVPPLAQLVLIIMLGGGAALTLMLAFHQPAWVTIPWSISLFFVVVYVLRGWILSGVGPRGLLDLCWAPVYMVWKVWLAVTRSNQKKNEWVRTTRQGERRD